MEVTCQAKGVNYMVGSLCAIDVFSTVTLPILSMMVNSLFESSDASSISFGTFAILSQALTSALIAATTSPIPNPKDIVEGFSELLRLSVAEIGSLLKWSDRV